VNECRVCEKFPAPVNRMRHNSRSQVPAVPSFLKKSPKKRYCERGYNTMLLRILFFLHLIRSIRSKDLESNFFGRSMNPGFGIILPPFEHEVVNGLGWIINSSLH